MAKDTVNLDALIPRADLDSLVQDSNSDGGDIPVAELQWGKLHQRLLRKPDFQRETDDWDVENVVTLIESFCSRHLIPALIMWQGNHSYSFVIDGAHRLSALIAWVNDDYGDGDKSRRFFGEHMPQKQKEAAERCRQQVRERVGTYADLSNLDAAASPERLRVASNIAKSLKTQWVTGDSNVAQDSFFKINQRSVAINDTEQYMIKSRRKANVIAARAILRSATGHAYWSKFSERKSDIEAKGREIYSVLFQPDSFTKGQHYMPVAGEAQDANALRIVVDLVTATTGKSDKEWADGEDDIDGTATLRALSKTFAVVKRIGGSNSASLGLHPFIYFWGASGNHSPSAFLAVVKLLQYLDGEGRFNEFSMYRARFEELLANNSAALKHISRTQGGWRKSVSKIFELYKEILSRLAEGQKDDEINGFLAIETPSLQRLTSEVESSPRISKGTKAAIARKFILDSAGRCWICHARLTPEDLSPDHKVKVSDGGLGNEENIAPSHHYCNSGFRPYLEHNKLSPPADPFS